MESRRYKNLQLFGCPSNEIGNFVDTSFLLGLIRGFDDVDPVTKGTSVAGGTPVEISFFSVLFIDQATESVTSGYDHQKQGVLTNQRSCCPPPSRCESCAFPAHGVIIYAAREAPSSSTGREGARLTDFQLLVFFMTSLNTSISCRILQRS